MESNWGNCVDNTHGNQVATLSCIWPLLTNIINAALALSGAVALILIIWSGIRIITAGGNPEQIEAGKKTLTFAIIGFVFIVLSFVFFNVFFNLLGVNQNTITPGPGGVQITPSL